MSGLKSASKLELSFKLYTAFHFMFIACVLLKIGCDKLSPVDCDRVLRVQLRARMLSICNSIAHVELLVGAMNMVNSIECA